MPLYDYRCTACSSSFELLVRSSTVPACPQCGSQQLERQVSLTAPQMQSRKIIQSARRLAAREGHFSNYSASERPRT